jgi:hypothetical protein
MRTTVKIDDDVLEAARSLAQSEKRSIGEILSELARRGLQPRSKIISRSGFPVFDVDDKAPHITPEMVKEAMDED